MSDDGRDAGERRYTSVVLTPEARRTRARNAANASWNNTTDRTARTAKARSALTRKFNTEEERLAYYQDMAQKSAATRRRNKHIADNTTKHEPSGPTTVLTVIKEHSPNADFECRCGERWAPEHLAVELYKDAYRPECDTPQGTTRW